MEANGTEERPDKAGITSRDTHAFLESLQSSASVGVGLVDRSFRFVHVNEVLATISGQSAADHIGRTLSEAVPTVWPEIETHCRRVLDTGALILNVQITGTTLAAPDRTRHWATTFYPVRSGDDIVGIGMLVTDMTERKEAQVARDEHTRAALAAVTATIASRDPYTADHQRRVAHLSGVVARAIGLDDVTVTGIRFTGSIHDIGILDVPAGTGERPGRVLPPEFEGNREHPRAGHDLIAGIDLPWPAGQMILQHHEHFDGSGYPGGLARDEILLGARVIAVTDTLDAISSHQPNGGEAAIHKIVEGRGAQFDPDVVDITLDLLRTGKISLDV